MGVKPGVDPSSFIRRARREQFVDLAVQLIGEGGVAAASTSEIARRAGVSRGVVNYNIGDRDALMDLVVARVYALGSTAVRPAVDAAGSATAALHAFVTASLEFYLDKPVEMRALREIFADPDLVDRAVTAGHRREIDDLVALLDRGMAASEFVAGDSHLVAAGLRGLLDHAASEVASGRDLGDLRTGLLPLVDRLVGAEPRGRVSSTSAG